MDAEYYYLIAVAISSVALIISLIVPYFSLKKVHKQIQISNLREYCKSYREILHKLPLEMFEERLPYNFEFPKEITLVICSYYGLLFEEFRLHKDRSIDDNTWADWENNLGKHAGTPGFQKAWNNTKNLFYFDNEFASFIDEKIRKATADKLRHD